MRRRLFAILSVLSLVLCVATCAMWVRSYHGDEWFRWQTSNPKTCSQGTYDLISDEGEIRITLYISQHEDPNEFARSIQNDPRRFSYTRGVLDWWDSLGDNQPPRTEFHGFLHSHERWRLGVPDEQNYMLHLPHWSLTLLFAILPAWLTGLVLKRTWRKLHTNNECLTCGYDLRATPGRCPECGTVPALNRKA